MKLLIQRVKSAKVEVDNTIVGKIEKGILVFLGVHKGDQESDIPWFINKMLTLRMFTDDTGKMNHSVEDVKGDVLIVSQFTLYGQCRNGRRPDFGEAAKGDFARALYLRFVEETQKKIGVLRVQTGQFAAKMEVSLVNDGPITFIIEK